MSVTAAAVAIAMMLLQCAARQSEQRAAPLSEAGAWLQSYLRFDTTNPPGDVGAAASYLASILAAEGIDHELIGAGDGHPSLWAELPATVPRVGGEQETLLLLHHLDVVAADDLWRVEPFSGEVREGVLWGRGAIDSKSLGTAHLAALVALHRSGAERRRGVAWLAAADEELGGRLGVERSLEGRPDLFAHVAAVVNEGGTNRGFDGRLHWWGIEIAQKRPLWLEASAADPVDLVAGLRRLVDHPPSWRVSPQARFTFAQMAPHYNEHWRSIFLDLDRFIAPAGPKVGLLPGMETFFLDSIQVNELEILTDGSGRARVDIRLLPDSEDADRLARIGELLGPAVATEVLLSAPPVAPSPWSGPFVHILRRQLRPIAPALPQMVGGITDSRYFRQRGIPAYGFSPFILDSEYKRTVHARDERIPLADFDRGTELMTRVVADWARGTLEPSAVEIKETP